MGPGVIVLPSLRCVYRAGATSPVLEVPVSMESSKCIVNRGVGNSHLSTVVTARPLLCVETSGALGSLWWVDQSGRSMTSSLDPGFMSVKLSAFNSGRRRPEKTKHKTMRRNERRTSFQILNGCNDDELRHRARGFSGNWSRVGLKHVAVQAGDRQRAFWPVPPARHLRQARDSNKGLKDGRKGFATGCYGDG